MTRAENVARARELRAQGLTLKEVADRMGVARSTVATWVSDPDLSKQRSRRERYRTPCPSCGEPMDGSGGYKTRHTLCQSCRDWPEEAVIDAMQRWADEHGGIPPTCTDWREAGPGHPSNTVTVIGRVGWNNLLLKAGFALRTDRRPETQEWIEEQIRAGVPTQQIADQLGVTKAAISQRMQYRGLSIRQLRQAAA